VWVEGGGGADLLNQSLVPLLTGKSDPELESKNPIIIIWLCVYQTQLFKAEGGKQSEMEVLQRFCKKWRYFPLFSREPNPLKMGYDDNITIVRLVYRWKRPNARARICKALRSLGIISLESILVSLNVYKFVL
jgi:hypothetical protein